MNRGWRPVDPAYRCVDVSPSSSYREEVMLKSFRKSTRRPYHRVRLLLERLEDRIAPSVTYDWVGGNQGDPNKWEEPKNWKNGTPNQFPGSNLGTPDDHAEFLGANSTFTCNLFSSR